jgi:DNA-binding HxlR family transcriptional regulator
MPTAARVKGATVTDILANDEISLLRSLEKKSRTITGNFTQKRYDRLEAKGYIKRSSQSPSMQNMLYEITDAGKATLRAAGGAAD